MIGSFFVAAIAFYVTTRLLDRKYPPGEVYERDNPIDNYPVMEKSAGFI